MTPGYALHEPRNLIVRDGREIALPKMSKFDVANRILDSLRAPFKLPGHDDVEVTVTASIGIATGLYHNPAPLFRDADQALYHAKAQGKDRHVTHRSAPSVTAPAR